MFGHATPTQRSKSILVSNVIALQRAPRRAEIYLKLSRLNASLRRAGGAHFRPESSLDAVSHDRFGPAYASASHRIEATFSTAPLATPTGAQLSHVDGNKGREFCEDRSPGCQKPRISFATALLGPVGSQEHHS
jgi:hypothetical protein